MKFIKVKSEMTGNISFAMLIDNYPDFLLFLQDREKDLATAYMECQESVRKFGEVTHTSRFAMVVAMTLDKVQGRKNFVDDIIVINDVLMKPYHDAFEKYGGFYVWQNVDKWEGLKYKYAGFTPFTENILDVMRCKLLETIEREDLLFPNIPNLSEKDISIKKWEGGRHYYAKVGNYDVEINGVRKWNTYEYAEDMAKKYLQNLLDSKQ